MLQHQLVLLVRGSRGSAVTSLFCWLEVSGSVLYQLVLLVRGLTRICVTVSFVG